MTGPVSEDIAISVPKAAARLGVSDWLIRDMIQRGELPSTRVRRRLLVPIKDLNEWVAAHTRQAS